MSIRVVPWRPWYSGYRVGLVVADDDVLFMGNV